MPPKKGKKRTRKDEQDELLERIETAKNEAVIGTKIDFEVRPKDEDAKCQIKCQQTKAGVLKQVLVGFFSNKGEGCALQIDAEDVTPELVGKAIQWAMVPAFQISWKELKEAPESIREKVTLINPAIDEDDPSAAAKDLQKEMNKPNMKWSEIRLLKGGEKAIVIPWSCKTNDSMCILPEKDEVVELDKPMDADNAATVGGAVLQRCKVALSREEANLHPGEEYKASRPKWAK